MTAASLIGFRFFERTGRGFELRLSWAEVTSGWGLAFALCMFHEHFSLHVHLGWPNLYIRLPFLQRWHRDPHEMMESWGFSLVDSAVHLNWGAKTKIVSLPWDWKWARTSIMLQDGTWYNELPGGKVSFPNDPRIADEKKPWGTYHQIKEQFAWKETYPYRYVLRSGEVQERTATVGIEEREWRWHWLQWLPFPRKIQRTIDITFSDEVGERSGSWKGGCTGCGYDIRHDEMPRECLARMEAERKF